MIKEKFKFNDYEYTVKIIREKNEFVFTLQHDKEMPSYLFKYYALNRNSLSAILNNYLYSAHPYELNDRPHCTLYSVM